MEGRGLTKEETHKKKKKILPSIDREDKLRSLLIK